MANNMPVRIEVDTAQAKKVHEYCYRRFNKPAAGMPRPGLCNYRYIPEKTFITTGVKGERDRANMYKKHQAVVGSLCLIRTEDIKALDVPAEMRITAADLGVILEKRQENPDYQGPVTTLRQVLMDLPFPLVPKEGQVTKKKLYHSVDFATSGPQAGIEVYLTAYEDRIEVASGLAKILPAYIKEFHGETAYNKWCNHQTEELGVEFDMDESFSWTGTWVTGDDKMSKSLLDEYVGIDLHLENLSVLESDKRVWVLEAGDASARTFNMGGSSTQTSIADDATLASNASGGVRGNE